MLLRVGGKDLRQLSSSKLALDWMRQFNTMYSKDAGARGPQ
jgi:hypothetical protein